MSGPGVTPAVNTTAAQFHDEQDVHRDEAVSTPHLDGHEVDGGNCRPVSAQKSVPRCSAHSLGGRVENRPDVEQEEVTASPRMR
jgi:hypothetical protein